MTMTIDDLDRDLERYRSAADTVSANLLELDGDPNRQLLETAPLTGDHGRRVGRRAPRAHLGLGLVRPAHHVPRPGHRAARAHRGPGSRPAASAPSPTSSHNRRSSWEATPSRSRDRDLLQERDVATSRCTADELLALMSDAFAQRARWSAGSAPRGTSCVPRLARAARAALTDVSGVERPRWNGSSTPSPRHWSPIRSRSPKPRCHDAEQSVAALTRAAAAARALRDEWQDRLRRGPHRAGPGRAGGGGGPGCPRHDHRQDPRAVAARSARGRPRPRRRPRARRRPRRRRALGRRRGPPRPVVDDPAATRRRGCRLNDRLPPRR